MAINRSKELFAHAQKVMVGGVNSPVRAFKTVGGSPLIMDHGRGSKLYDVDGNEYTDYCLSWGALIYGHAHRNVVLAVKKRINKGSSFGATTKAEIDMAELIVKRIPSIDLVRFVNSGTEATMSAIRLARGFTKKNIVIKFDGCYHGHCDDLLIKAGSGVAQLKESSSSGVPESHIQHTMSLPYNDAAVFAEAVDRHKEDIACVIVEPVAGNMGVIPADRKFLKTLRELTKKNNIVLIFDEIITGFRVGLGGAQAEYGIAPDLTCLGKIIGGGFPVGAYGGRKDIMNCLAPLGSVYQAGTFSGHPVVLRAGLETLKLLDQSFYGSLNSKSQNVAQALNAFFVENNIPAHISFFKSMLSLRFRTEAVVNYRDAQNASNAELYARLFQFLLSRGIYFPPADLESFFISGMHSQKELNQLMETVKSFFTAGKGKIVQHEKSDIPFSLTLTAQDNNQQ